MSGRHHAVIGAIVMAAAAVAIGRAQAPTRDVARMSATGSAVITGAVLSSTVNREPARHVTVTLSGGPDDRRAIGTDDRGQFLFVGLPAGSYTLSVSKPGWLSANYGAPKFGLAGTPISLADGQRFTAEPILLARGATISGRLVDSRNTPVSGALVEAVQFTIANGEWTRRTLQGTNANISTNAHGEFRLFGLPPGEYVVSASMFQSANTLEIRETSGDETRWAEQFLAGRGGESSPSRGRTIAPSPTYFPGVPDVRGATVIHLDGGEERNGVDFAFQYAATARVSGILTGPDGAPAPNATVTRVRRFANDISMVGSIATTDRTDATGRFSLSGVAPGSYWITVRASQPGPPVRTLWGAAEISVAGQDIANLAIALQPGISIAGKFVFEGRAAVSDIAGMQLRLIPAVGGAPVAATAAAALRPDGGFQFTSVFPGTYRFLALSANTPNPAWVARSAMLDGKDLLDTPVDVRPGVDLSDVLVTFTDNVTDLSGSLLTSAGRAAPQLYVLAYPGDRTLWMAGSRRIKIVRADTNAVYKMAGLPSGEYLLCALTEYEPAQLNDPAFLEQLVSASIRITLADGEKQKQDLRIGG